MYLEYEGDKSSKFWNFLSLVRRSQSVTDNRRTGFRKGLDTLQKQKSMQKTSCGKLKRI